MLWYIRKGPGARGGIFPGSELGLSGSAGPPERSSHQARSDGVTALHLSAEGGHVRKPSERSPCCRRCCQCPFVTETKAYSAYNTCLLFSPRGVVFFKHTCVGCSDPGLVSLQCLAAVWLRATKIQFLLRVTKPVR